MPTSILLLFLAQAGTMHPVLQPQLQGSASILPGFAEQPQVDDAANQEREFVQRINGLSLALNAFAETYRDGKVDVKKVNAVRKAMHELEKSEWFRPQKAK